MKSTIIQSFNNYFSASIILGKLETEGISCYLIDEHSATLYPSLANSINGIKLAVDNRQIERATDLLNQFHVEFSATAKCPCCRNIGFVITEVTQPETAIMKLYKLFFAAYKIPTEIIYQCMSCKYKSKNLPEIDEEF